MNAKRTGRPQISLSMLLMLNVVFCGIGGAIYWASQVPAIRNEVSMMLGGRGGGAGEDSRAMHMAFLIFTYSAPRLLAGTVSTLMSVLRWWERRGATPSDEVGLPE
jgi:hypothetical protein